MFALNFLARYCSRLYDQSKETGSLDFVDTEFSSTVHKHLHDKHQAVDIIRNTFCVRDLGDGDWLIDAVYHARCENFGFKLFFVRLQGQHLTISDITSKHNDRLDYMIKLGRPSELVDVLTDPLAIHMYINKKLPRYLY